MVQWLRQSTAVDLPIGPFVDQTDGFTAETGLTLSQADIRLKKNGGNWAQKNQANSASHEENGWYEVSLDTTDTNTLGLLTLAVNESGALPVWHQFLVVPSQVWDSFLGADALQVHAVEISNDLITAAAIADNAIDAGAIASNAITAAKIASDAITSAKVADGFITAAKLASDTITAAKIATDAITAAKIAADAITAAKIADGAIDAGAIADNAITSAKIADNAITAAKLAANAITAAAIAANAITSSQVADGAITAAKIASDAITADKIAADAIGASELAASAVSEIVTAVAAPSAAVIAEAVREGIVEGTLSLEQVLRIILAACAGVSSAPSAGTRAYRDVGNTKNRILATVSAGDRSSVSLDGSA